MDLRVSPHSEPRGSWLAVLLPCRTSFGQRQAAESLHHSRIYGFDCRYRLKGTLSGQCMLLSVPFNPEPVSMASSVQAHGEGLHCKAHEARKRLVYEG